MELQTLESLQAAVLFVHESMDDSAWLLSSNHCENAQRRIFRLRLKPRLKEREIFEVLN